MAGVLEWLGASTGDPQKDAAVNHGILQAGLALLANQGRSLGPALGQAGMQGIYGMQQFQQNQNQNASQQMMLEEMRRRQSMENLPQQYMRKPDTMDNRDVGQPGEQAPTLDYANYTRALSQYDPVAALHLQTALTPKPEAPIKVGPGDQLVQPGTFKQLYNNPKAESEDPFIRLLKESGIDPKSPQGQALIQARLAKESTHAPAASANVNVNTEKPLLNSIAGGLGTQIDTSLSNARSATNAIGTAQQLKAAIDSGKVVSGPGAKFRIFGLQLGQTLGVGGKDGAEKLANTRGAIQGMAKAELDAAQQMKGQGQITEAERDIIRRAASGDIESLTTSEMRLLADSMEKTARFKIQAHKKNVEALSKMPNAAPLLPFYNVDEPPAYQAPGAQGIRRYNPQTGRLE